MYLLASHLYERIGIVLQKWHPGNLDFRYKEIDAASGNDAKQDAAMVALHTVNIDLDHCE